MEVTEIYAQNETVEIVTYPPKKVIQAWNNWGQELGVE